MDCRDRVRARLLERRQTGIRIEPCRLFQRFRKAGRRPLLLLHDLVCSRGEPINAEASAATPLRGDRLQCPLELIGRGLLSDDVSNFGVKVWRVQL